MSSASTLLNTLKSVTGTGNFHSTGNHDFFLPGLVVGGFGEVPLPLHPVVAEGLKQHAEAAPYGKGEETVLDESVRKCWQIDASRFHFTNPAWETFLAELVAHVATDLGVTGSVQAEPYKLLLYEKGGHFLPHRDTEKVGAMFGTLLIALPSEFTGGELLIRHDGREITVDFGEKNPVHQLRHAALFADCEHEVRPVKSGYRCCLVFNLSLKKGDPCRLNQPSSAHAALLLPDLKKLRQSLDGELAAILLEHHYTEANFSLRHLKNNDQARAAALLTAAREAGLEASLALLTFHQMGQMDDDDDFYYSRRGRNSYREPKEGTMGEIYEESLTLSHWRSDKDKPLPLGDWQVKAEDIISEQEVGSGEPHEKEAEGYTGNAGCTMDHWYRHAAIVVWPKEDDEKLLAQHNLHSATEQLLSLSNKKNSARFPKLARAIFAAIKRQAEGHAHRTYYQNADLFRNLLSALARQKEEALLTELLDTLPYQTFVSCDLGTWMTQLAAFSPGPFLQAAKALPAEDREPCRESFFLFLEGLLSKKPAPEIVRGAYALVAPFKPRERQSHESYSPWSNHKPLPPKGIQECHALLAASADLDAREQKAVLAFVLHDGSLDHLRTVLGPALLEKTVAKHLQNPASLFPTALKQAISQLTAETARPLPPYPDWTRPCPELKQPYGNSDPALKELEAFMRDPSEATHDFRAVQHTRSNLEETIRRHTLDLRHETIKKGTPHTLRCTKTDASHQRALKQRSEDEKLLEKLRKLV